jgi:putative membrane protein
MKRTKEDAPMPGRTGEAAGAGRPGESSAIRDHLANERTYLAWLRTGMALLGLGFVVVRLRVELSPSLPPAVPGWPRGTTIGLGFAGLGMLSILFATWRYLAVRRMIDSGRFVPLGAGVIAISSGALLIAIAVILYLLRQLFP